jgi:hypothetical protein
MKRARLREGVMATEPTASFIAAPTCGKHVPAGSFMAAGSQGQYTIVLPSEDLVIVRIGWAYTPDADRVAIMRLVRETIAALRAEKCRES